MSTDTLQSSDQINLLRSHHCTALPTRKIIQNSSDNEKDGEMSRFRANNKDKNSKSSKLEGFASLFANQAVLCHVPIWILIVVASLDNADKQLMASSFAVLEKTLNLDVKLLGYFSLSANLAYACSLPVWGFLLHKHGMDRIHSLLSVACASWGVATIGIALSGESIMLQVVFRSLVGFALGSIMPLSQALLVEMVPDSVRGRAFGLMGVCEKLAGTLGAASIVYWEEQWTRPYMALGVFSVAIATLSNYYLAPQQRIRRGLRYTEKINSEESHTKEPKLTLRQILTRISRIPAFACLVAQGVFGGTPWDMMAFLLLLLDWRNFTKEQIISLQFTFGLSTTVGGWLGGMLGDWADQRYHHGSRGRIAVAFTSVVGGIPLYGCFLFAKSYTSALLWYNLFGLVAMWCTSGALRPICAELGRNSSERAQIVSFWIVLEKTSGALFGAPLVGYLTSGMLEDKSSIDNNTKADALAWNIFGLSTLFWSICSVFWLLMSRFIANKQPSGVSGSVDSEKVSLV